MNPEAGYSLCFAKVYYETEEEKAIAQSVLKDYLDEIPIIQNVPFYMADQKQQNYYDTKATKTIK